MSIESRVQPAETRLTIEETLDFVREQIRDDGRFELSDFRGETRVVIDPEDLRPVCRALKQTEPYHFLYLSDLTAVDYPDREEGRFDVVYQLYSFHQNQRLRLRLIVDEDQPVPSVTPIWRTANWLEREVYDLFGIEFEDHPNLERIMMPKGTRSHPLRKDYPLQPRDDFQARRPNDAQQAEEWGEEFEHHPR